MRCSAWCLKVGAKYRIKNGKRVLVNYGERKKNRQKALQRIGTPELPFHSEVEDLGADGIGESTE